MTQVLVQKSQQFPVNAAQDAVEVSAHISI